MEEKSASKKRKGREKPAVADGDDAAELLRELITISTRTMKRLKNIEMQLSALVSSVDELEVQIQRKEHEVDDVSELSSSSSSSLDGDNNEEKGKEVPIDYDDEVLTDLNDIAWREKFRELREFKKKYGHTKVPGSDSELSKWARRQRATYNNLITGKGRDKMKPHRIPLLESIGFWWGVKYPEPPTWDEMFDRLQSYNKIIGGYDVPFHEENPSGLARWMAYQRREYHRLKKGRDSLLTKSQIKKLEKIGMNWDGPSL